MGIKEHTSFNQAAAPDLDAETANQLLHNVFAACEMESSQIPVEVLESWGNYKRPRYLFLQKVTFVVLLLLILLPLLFFKPVIVAERTEVSSQANAVFHIDVDTLLPVRAVSATLDGRPIRIQEVNNREYAVEVTRNGELELQAVSVNGQVSKKTVKVNHIDTEKPEFINSYTESGNVVLLVRDTYSGIDYGSIRGVPVVSYDEEEGEIVCEIPDEPTSIVIPDKAGNELELLISPVEKGR